MTISIRSENNWNYTDNLKSDLLRAEKYFKSLRTLAQSRIKTLYGMMKISKSKDSSVYLDEIKKVFMDEQERKLRKKRGEVVD